VGRILAATVRPFGIPVSFDFTKGRAAVFETIAAVEDIYDFVGLPISSRPGQKRCSWADSSPAMGAYHDLDWGVPSRNDRYLFEMLTLEGAQAGLSWATILNRREGYRRAFANFDPVKVAKFTDRKLEMLLGDAGIIRNRLKIYGTRTNARAFVKVQAEFGSFAKYLWAWVDGAPVVNRPRTLAEIPATTDLSDRISKDLKRRNFTFVGSTIVYATLQSAGLVDDHVISCPFKRG
jgi:DNA-3-methyladenine glycosylase I